METLNNMVLKTKNCAKNHESSRSIGSLIKISGGFTIAELVVSVAIMATLTAVAVPTFSKLQERTQKERNTANMHVIREIYFHYYFKQHMQGNPHFPPPPDDNLMDEGWANDPIEGNPTQTPASLFSDGKIPLNSLGNPFFYDVTYTYDENGVSRPTLILRDTDELSPSSGLTFSYSL